MRISNISALKRIAILLILAGFVLYTPLVSLAAEDTPPPRAGDPPATSTKEDDSGGKVPIPTPKTGAQGCKISTDSSVAKELTSWAGLLDLNCTTLTSSGECTFDDTETDCASCCLVGNLIKIKLYLFYGILFVGMAIGLYGGWQVVTAKDNQDQAKKGATFIMYGLAGIVLAMIVQYLPRVIVSILGFTF